MCCESFPYMAARPLPAIKSAIENSNRPALEALLAADPQVAKARGGELIRVAFGTLLRRIARVFERGEPSNAEAKATDVFQDDFRDSLRALLKAGASPNVTIPADFALHLPWIEQSSCSRPLEVILAGLPCSLPHLVLLVEFGSRLDGVCDGLCSQRKQSRCCAIEAALGRALLYYEMCKRCPSTRPELPPGVSIESIVSVDAEVLRLLIKSGAGDAPLAVPGMGCKLPAMKNAMLQAVLWRADIVVRSLIAAGCPVDWDFPPPLSRGLVFAAVEEATSESAGDLDDPQLTTGSRENKLRQLALKHKYAIGGPAHECLKAILAAGVPKTLNEAPVSHVTGAVGTILSNPCQQGVVSLVRMLLRAGADPNVVSDELRVPSRGPFGLESPLEKAVAWGHLDVAEVLIAAGARITTRCIAAAAESGWPKILRFLLARVPPSVRDGVCLEPPSYTGKTPLQIACLFQQIDCVNELLSNDASATASTPPLGVPASPYADYLHGDALSASTSTPMSCALFGGGDAAIVDALVAAGAASPHSYRSGAATRSSTGASAAAAQPYFGPSVNGNPIPQDAMEFARNLFASAMGPALGAPAATRLACDYCGAHPGRVNSLLLCGACKTRRYCNATCQRAAWKGHKAECKGLASELHSQEATGAAVTRATDS